MTMFDFLLDVGNYDDRKVARYDASNLHISTAQVSDGRQPYETAIGHLAYVDEGKWIIVEAYDTRESALEGHNRWVQKMTEDKLPKALMEIANSHIQGMLGLEIYQRRN